MPQNPSNNSYIHLGTFLDQLFNRDCRLENTNETGKQLPGAFLIPQRNPDTPLINTPGTGNIVILGDPGTGKTTLALHIAAMCSSRPDNSNLASAYIPLEEDYGRVKAKGRQFGWDPYIQPMFSINDITSPPSPKELEKWLRMSFHEASGKINNEIELLKRNSQREFSSKDKPRPILVPSLTPRGTAKKKPSAYEERFGQLETFLTAAEYLSNNKDKNLLDYDLRVICLDNLSVFGEQLLSREELLRIFNLFSQKNVIGVFIAEDRSRFTSSADEQYMETIDNLADVVVQLETGYPDDYFRRTIEIKKSRYVNNLLGKHAFKIEDIKTETNPDTLTTLKYPNQVRNRNGIVPLLSIDYFLSEGSGEINPGEKKSLADERLLFGPLPLNSVLPPNYKRDSVVVIEGPRLTFKTALGINYLLHGIFHESNTPHHTENALLIRLYDTPHLSVFQPFYGQTRLLQQFAQKWRHEKPQPLSDYFQNIHYARGFWQGIREGNLFDLVARQTLGDLQNSQGVGGLIELNIKTGKLLPEEVLIYIWEIIFLASQNKTPVTRVFIDDISSIGVSYPAIYANGSFLQGLARMLRQRRIGLVISGTTGEYGKSDEVINQAKTISNTVITTELCEIYGEKLVTISGEGLNAGQSKHSLSQLEAVPLTLRADEDFRDPSGKDIAFVVDKDQLAGLIGFQGPERIRRPGITFYVFQEGESQKDYNDKLNFKLQMCFGKPILDGFAPDSDKSNNTSPLYQEQGNVELIRFGSQYASSCFDAVKQQYKHGRPIDRTVLCVLDEYTIKSCQDRFAQLFFDENNNPTSILPYYKNVLLVALKKEFCDKNNIDQNVISWEFLNRYGIIFGDEIKETIICSWLDALYSSGFMASGDEILDFNDFVDCLDDFIRTQQTIPGELKAMINIYNRSNRPKNEPDQYTQYHIGMYVKDNDSGTDKLLSSNGRIGWYSKIVDELKEKKDDLKEKKSDIEIFALPRGGFRGDWYIGVLKGSASLHLGKNAVELLCHPREQFLRYYSCVGLPNSLNHDNSTPTVLENFNAMYQNEKFNLDHVLDIHRKAKIRSRIPEYNDLRVLIHPLVIDMATILERGNNRVDDELYERFRQFPEQLRRLKHKHYYE